MVWVLLLARFQKTVMSNLCYNMIFPMAYSKANDASPGILYYVYFIYAIIVALSCKLRNVSKLISQLVPEL